MSMGSEMNDEDRGEFEGGVEIAAGVFSGLHHIHRQLHLVLLLHQLDIVSVKLPRAFVRGTHGIKNGRHTCADGLLRPNLIGVLKWGLKRQALVDGAHPRERSGRGRALYFGRCP
jgi:hypothetical protein